MPWPTTLVRGAALAALPVALVVGAVATLLLVVADTWTGRALGLGFSCAALATVLLPFALVPGAAPLDRTTEEAYLWVLRRVAHAHGYALVAPSYGLGLWHHDEGTGTVDRTLAWMESTGQFDMSRVALAALSNGGRGVPAAVERRSWRGVAWLSAVMYEDAMRQIGAALAVPLLVLHGGADDRIPLRFVTAAVEALRDTGASVELDVVDDADHFLLFTHRERLDAALDRWLTAVDTETPGEPAVR